MSEAQPAKWYQWVLLYPALITTAFGSVPTVLQGIKAWRLDASYSEVQIVEKQKLLWERNIECLSAKAVYSVDGPNGIVISVILCSSGDVLLRYKISDSNITYTWVQLPQRKQRGGVALADPVLMRSSVIYGAVRCARLLSPLVVWITTVSGEECNIEHIDIRRGIMLTRIRVLCSTPCAALRSETQQ